MEVCCNPARLLHAAGYRERYEAYAPPAELIAELESIGEPVTVLVVYGTWCNDSRRVVPEVVKALELASNDQLRLLAVHVSYAETDPSPFRAGSVEVSRYPTVALLAGHFDAASQIPPGSERVRFVEQSLDGARVRAAFAADN